MWRVHMNRVDQGMLKSYINSICIGLDGTYNQNGIYTDKGQDQSQQINNGVHLRMDQITHGILEK